MTDRLPREWLFASLHKSRRADLRRFAEEAAACFGCTAPVSGSNGDIRDWLSARRQEWWDREPAGRAAPPGVPAGITAAEADAWLRSLPVEPNELMSMKGACRG